MVTSLPKWSEITREERFFTCLLFHDLVQNPQPFWDRLRGELAVERDAAVVDVGYEVCFFRDAAREDLIERSRLLEKQTFDLVLTLSSQAIVVIEAKAQQGYGMGQLEQLASAKAIIEASPKCPVRKVYLAGLCSSNYKLRPLTGSTTGWGGATRASDDSAVTRRWTRHDPLDLPPSPASQ